MILRNNNDEISRFVIQFDCYLYEIILKNIIGANKKHLSIVN